MAPPAGCPDLDLLQRLSLEQLSPSEAWPIHKHLVKCPICAETVKSFKDAAALITTSKPALPAMGSSPSNYTQAGSPRRSPPPEPRGKPAAQSARTLVEQTPLIHATPYGFLAPPQAEDELGRLGNYRVLKALGAGGMGVVFQAEDLILHRVVALKVMKPEQAVDPIARRRFLREGQAMASLHHDHIASVYQVGEDRGIPFMVMEFLEGESLEAALLRQQPLLAAEVIRIGREVAAGLVEAHAHGLIHRDIKPSNIWLERVKAEEWRLEGEEEISSSRSTIAPRVKILDFGLARIISDQSQYLTQTGYVVGTPGYLAPEQASGKELDGRCDLFSLGCVLYEMGTGVEPFRRADTMATLMALALEQPQPPRQLNPVLPAALAELIMRLLAKNPGDRPRSAQAVVQALATIAYHEEMASSASIAEPRPIQDGLKEVALPSPGLPLVEPPVSKGWAALGVSLVGVVALLTFGLWLLKALLE